VDVGGGEGGVIPNFRRGKKFVLDPNANVSLPSGIERIYEYAELKEVKPDLIMCCGLLEHLNSPTEFLEELISWSPTTKYYYFEVPAGIPNRRRKISSFILFQILICRSQLSWRFFSILDNKLSSLGLKGFFPLKCSEHLNFFSESGLQFLMRKNNLDIVVLRKFSTNENLPDASGLAFSDAWQLLAKKS
jgi:hypothetical protein